MEGKTLVYLALIRKLDSDRQYINLLLPKLVPFSRNNSFQVCLISTLPVASTMNSNSQKAIFASFLVAISVSAGGVDRASRSSHGGGGHSSSGHGGSAHGGSGHSSSGHGGSAHGGGGHSSSGHGGNGHSASWHGERGHSGIGHGASGHRRDGTMEHSVGGVGQHVVKGFGHTTATKFGKHNAGGIGKNGGLIHGEVKPFPSGPLRLYQILRIPYIFCKCTFPIISLFVYF